MAQKVYPIGSKMRPQRFQVFHLIAQCAGLPRRDRRRTAIPALVIEYDAPVLRNAIPGIGDTQVSMIEAWAAIRDHKRRAVSGSEYLEVERDSLRLKGLARLGRPRDDYKA